MPKFIVMNQELCTVKWFYEVEAEDENDALEKFLESAPIGHYIGESNGDCGDEVIDRQDFYFQNMVKEVTSP